MSSLYNSVMNSEENHLRVLPAAQRFQIMTYLSLMWTTIFCIGTGYWFLYGTLIMGHLAVALGIATTVWTFRNAKKSGIYRDFTREDGTARYDDVWGG